MKLIGRLLVSSMAGFAILYVNAISAQTVMPKSFLGKWTAADNPNHYVLVSDQEIRWERGDSEGPDIVPASKYTYLNDKNAISFPVRSSVGAVVGGQLVRGTVTVEMSLSGNDLVIRESPSTTISPGAGFAFQQLGGKRYTYKKVAEPSSNEQLRSAFFKGNVTDSATGQKFQVYGGGTGKIDGGKTAVLFIIGIPFSPPESLVVEGELDTPITIKIEGYDKGKNHLLPTKDSPVPQGEPDWSKNTMGKWFTHAANVTWVFTRSGISFETHDAVYSSSKDGATIAFTNQGTQFDGIAKSPRR